MTADEIGYYRLADVIGDRRRGIPAIIPVSRSTWYEGVKTGRFPAGIKASTRLTIYPKTKIHALARTLCQEAA